MMKFELVILIVILLINKTAVCGQTLPTNKEQCDFLIWYAKHVEIIGLYDSIVTIPQKMMISNSNIAKKDLKYLLKQINRFNLPSKLDSTLLKGVYWKADTKQVTPSTLLSFPLFLQNKNVVFIYRRFVCGEQCGQEGIEVYIKMKVYGWKSYNKFHFPISMF